MELELNKIYHGDALEQLKSFPDKLVNMCVTSPPYWGLRDYGDGNNKIWGGDQKCSHQWGDKIVTNERGQTGKGNTGNHSKEIPGQGKKQGHGNFCQKCGAWKGQLGLEPNPELYVKHLVFIFQEVKRVLKNDGTLWLNLGDSYAGSNTVGRNDKERVYGSNSQDMIRRRGNFDGKGLKQKDLVGIPWRVAFALQEDGWYLRNDIIWHKCLSGGTNLYAKTQKGIITSKLKDLARLDPKTVKLWDGGKWNQVIDFVPQERDKQPIEITLRSGERINCTPEHKFPTRSGIKKAENLNEGDILQSTKLPNNGEEKMIDEDIGWLVGYYLAEGSRDDRNNLRFSSHEDEDVFHRKLDEIANKYYGKVRHHNLQGKSYASIVSGNFLKGAIDEFIRGDNAKNKGLTNKVWRQSDKFLESLLKGYLDGDGYYDENNNRYTIRFTRNYRLEKDLRTLCGRLDYQLRLKPVIARNQDGEHKAFRGEIRFTTNNHHNQKSDNEVIKISNSRSRKFWDVVLENNPHIFALGSGILSHNSNPMPESVTDRCTTSHEHIFLLAKSKQYYYDQDAIKEPTKSNIQKRKRENGVSVEEQGKRKGEGDITANCGVDRKKNKRDVWKVNTKPFSEAHFAVYPPELIRPCIKAGCPDDGVVLDPFIGAGTTGKVALKENKNFVGIELNKEYIDIANKRLAKIDSTYNKELPKNKQVKQKTFNELFE